MLNANMLKSKMVLFGDTQQALANALNISRATLVSRLSNQSSFTQAEIYNIKLRYELSAEEIIDIFFAQEITQNVINEK